MLKDAQVPGAKATSHVQQQDGMLAVPALLEAMVGAYSTMTRPAEPPCGKEAESPGGGGGVRVAVNMC